MANRGFQQSMALRQLQSRLQKEQLAFDPGDPQYNNYQTQLDAIATKNDALAQARLRARPEPPIKERDQ